MSKDALHGADGRDAAVGVSGCAAAADKCCNSGPPMVGAALGGGVFGNKGGGCGEENEAATEGTHVGGALSGSKALQTAPARGVGGALGGAGGAAGILLSGSGPSIGAG